VSVRTVGLVLHPLRARAVSLAEEAVAVLERQGVDVRVSTDDAVSPALAPLAMEPSAFSIGLDVVVSLGGDGTMLRAIDLVAEAGVPVLGVNAGRLGYLSEVEAEDLGPALERLLDGRFEVTERMMLAVEVTTTGAARGRWLALNEAVVEKPHMGRLAHIEVEINGSPFTTYAADGVIVATPTGSTAYSFSARGPIVSPRHRCLLLTPVSPHMLFDRSLVLGPQEEIRIVVGDEAGVIATVDGRELGALQAGDAITCTAAPVPARIVGFGARDFHQVLKAKFGLADR
jgi:NAD+ kinase